MKIGQPLHTVGLTDFHRLMFCLDARRRFFELGYRFDVVFRCG